MICSSARLLMLELNCLDENITDPSHSQLPLNTHFSRCWCRLASSDGSKRNSFRNYDDLLPFSAQRWQWRRREWASVNPPNFFFPLLLNVCCKSSEVNSEWMLRSLMCCDEWTIKMSNGESILKWTKFFFVISTNRILNSTRERSLNPSEKKFEPLSCLLLGIEFFRAGSCYHIALIGVDGWGQRDGKFT